MRNNRISMNITDKEKNTIGCIKGLVEEILNDNDDNKITKIENLFAHSNLQLDVNQYKPNESYMFLTDVFILNIIPLVYGKIKGISESDAMIRLNEISDKYRSDLLKMMDDVVKEAKSENK